MIIRVFDIETVPDLDVWTPPENKPDAFPPPQAHKVVALRWIDLDASPVRNTENKYRVVPGYTGSKGEASEHKILEDFGASCEAIGADLHLLSWNGRRFDGPVLAMRAMKHAIPWGWWYNHTPPYRYRYSEFQGHIDLMDVLSDFGSAPAMRMGDAAKLCGMPGKTDMDGSKVADEIAAGRAEKVSRYCLFDVVQTAGIYLRFQLQKGVITRQNVDLVFGELEDMAMVSLGRLGSSTQTIKFEI